MSTQFTTYVPYTGWQPGSGILLPAAPMGALVTPPEGTWLTPKAKDSVVTLKLCEGCRRTYASGADWHLYPGDYLAAFRAAGSVPVALCDDCKLEDREVKVKAATEVAEIMVALRADRERSRTPHYKRNPESEQRARKHYAKWRVPLMEALKASGDQGLTSREIAAVMGVKAATARMAQSALWRARRVGIEFVILRRQGEEGKHGYHCLYGLGQGAPLNNPQDSETKQFMREALDA